MDEQSIFFEALEKTTAEEQAAWLDHACDGDETQKQRILQLLQKHAKAQSFLEKPAPRLEETITPDASGHDLAAALDAGLALSFDGEAAVVIGDANHSVLRSLGNTLNEVPTVLLREPQAEGAEPISRPNSPEMPDRQSDSRYRLDGEIARGGMGAIIKGRDTDLGRDLAIKVLLDSHKDKPEVIQRFVEEAQIGGQLQHPGIAPIYELGQFADKRPFFAMKLVKGQTLSKLLKERDDPAEDRGRFIGIFEQVCQTMAYAHSRGVIHRDLKPANIMIGAFGEVQVMDWGLAKVLPAGGIEDEKQAHSKHKGVSIIQTMRSGVGSDSPGVLGSIGSQTQMGSVMGTPAYMPPEQALGEIDQMDERADVFGLGAILCEILTGQPPYVADDGTLVFRMASRGKLEDAFSRLDACGLDEDLIALTKHCLELDPVHRPRNSGVLADRVTGYLESVEAKLREAEVKRAAQAARADAETQRAEAESARACEENRRRRLSLALAASMLLLLSFGGGGWLYIKTAEADAQRQHAEEMQSLAEQRDVQRKAALTNMEQLAASYLNQESYDEARDLWSAVVRMLEDSQDGKDEVVRLLRAIDQLAETYLRRLESEKAVPLFERAIQLGDATGTTRSESARIRARLAEAYGRSAWSICSSREVSAEDVQRAEQLAEEAVRLTQPSVDLLGTRAWDSAGIWLSKAAVHLRKEEFDACVACLNRPMSLDGVGGMLFVPAMAEFRRGDKSLARSYFYVAFDGMRGWRKGRLDGGETKLSMSSQKWIKQLNGIQQEAAEEMGILDTDIWHLSKPEEFIEAYTTLIERFPETVMFHERRAKHYARMGKFDQARSDLVQAASLDEESVAAMRNLGIWSLFLDDMPGYEAICNRALDRFADGKSAEDTADILTLLTITPETVANRSVIRDLLKDIESFERDELVGLAMLRLGKPREAIRNLLHPPSATANLACTIAYAELRQPEEAKARFEIAVKLMKKNLGETIDIWDMELHEYAAEQLLHREAKSKLASN